MDSKVIFGQVNICKHYKIGKDTFKELQEIEAPIQKINNRYFIHIETMDQFLKDLSTSVSK